MNDQRLRTVALISMILGLAIGLAAGYSFGYKQGVNVNTIQVGPDFKMEWQKQK